MTATDGVAALAGAYAERRLDPVAATERVLSRIAIEDSRLRSYITVARELALAAAEESRCRWQAGRPIGPLDGVPLALKDNIDVAGLPCTAGTAAFRDRVPAADAAVVARLRLQGAVLLGKLNMHEAALGATTDNPVFGRCMNPLRAGYTPGGSSGGSGAAVAAGLCAAALGTDTLGSVRVPASYCGVWGFKPSNAAIPTEGVVPLSVTLDTVGPLARSAEDLVILARALLDDPPRRRRDASGPADLASLRIGVPRALDNVAIEPEVSAAFARFLDGLREAGASVAPVDLAAWRPGAARRAGLLVAEAEGHTYYVAALGPQLPGLSETLASFLRYPARAGQAKIVAAYQTFEAIRAAVQRAFAEVDLLALPTTPQRSFPHGGAVPENQADCAALANLARAPALSLPVEADGLPAGMQVMAAPGDDLWLLGLAPALARATTALTRSAASASP